MDRSAASRPTKALGMRRDFGVSRFRESTEKGGPNHDFAADHTYRDPPSVNR